MKIQNNLFTINFQNYLPILAQVSPVEQQEPVRLEQSTWRRFSLWTASPVHYRLGRADVSEPKGFLLASVCFFLAAGIVLYLL